MYASMWQKHHMPRGAARRKRYAGALLTDLARPGRLLGEGNIATASNPRHGQHSSCNQAAHDDIDRDEETASRASPRQASVSQQAAVINHVNICMFITAEPI